MRLSDCHQPLRRRQIRLILPEFYAFRGISVNLITKLAAAFTLAASTATHAAAAEQPVELSSTELGAQQSRTYSIPANILFSATIATLQTLGYVDINSSRDAGTVSGTTESKAKTIYNIFWGFGKKKYTQKASLLVEDYGGTQALVRLNLHVHETKARGIFGTSFTDGKLVRFAGPYQEFFNALDAEVARRMPAAPTMMPTPSTVPTETDSAANPTGD